MAAYAALVSLLNNMEQIRNHPRLSISFDEKQIESLIEKVGLLLDFVERDKTHGGMVKEAEDLEREIASAAHAAEDVIESHVVDQILAGSSAKRSIPLLDLQKVIDDLDSVKEKVMEAKEKWGFKEDQQPTYSTSSASPTTLTSRKTTMVGFDDELIQLMDMLTGQQSCLQIIAIVGMGGIGKTTLAKNAYENFLIMQHFDIRAWATTTQEYSVKEILSGLLSCQGKSTSGTEDELGEQLYKSLYGRRYLIILDDMWSTEVWNKLKFFFPNNCSGSRVVVTTRLSNLAIHCGSSCFRMNFLDEDKSWNLFCEMVFGGEDCPPELVKIGMKIVEQCKGLPLSIVVTGGLLRNSYRTIEYWQNVSENINSILNLGENEQCLNVLSLSYNQLPAHLKPCFLYMGIFQEDSEIRVSQIIKLWVAEGFLKPNGAQILEEIAEGYLKDLIDRNLILVGRHRQNGKIRSCRIHDLLRDLCLRIAKKENFFYLATASSISQGVDMEHRLIFHDFILKSHNHGVFHALGSASLARSLICKGVELPVRFRLLRVLHGSLHAKFQSVNLRYFAYQAQTLSQPVKLYSSISRIWNLQTLIIAGIPDLIVAPVEIWKMPQLRHIECNNIYIRKPPRSDEQDDFFVLGNLQTLRKVVNFRWSEEACKRIPNIRKSRMVYAENWKGYHDRLYYSLSNLGRLHKLESLEMKFYYGEASSSIYLLKENLMFPSSLKKLSLKNCHLHWDDLTMIGSLPQLEVLKLEEKSFMGSEWRPVEGEFLGLKLLSIDSCDLIYWIADSSHFPVLEKLVLGFVLQLDEIPWGIGEIPTLELIHLDHCSHSAVISAMKIKEEQQSLGNYGLQIRVQMSSWHSVRFREWVEIEGLSINDIQLEVV